MTNPCDGNFDKVSKRLDRNYGFSNKRTFLGHPQFCNLQKCAIIGKLTIFIQFFETLSKMTHPCVGHWLSHFMGPAAAEKHSVHRKRVESMCTYRPAQLVCLGISQHRRATANSYHNKRVFCFLLRHNITRSKQFIT